jgi:hypothetical protein
MGRRLEMLKFEPRRYNTLDDLIKAFTKRVNNLMVVYSNWEALVLPMGYLSFEVEPRHSVLAR